MKNFLNLQLLILSAILLLGGIIRFWDLGKNPPSLNWDEVSIGYNAYSVLKTGADEYASKLPLFFRSLDDYKQPVYPYLTVISEYIFGITPFAVRLPAALLGIFTVIIVYFLVKELLHNKNIALLSAFLLAISPWHVQFSRVAIEANIGLFFLTSAVLIFLLAIKKSSWLLPVSSVLFVLAMYSYLSFRIIVPLMVISLLVIYWKEIAKKRLPFILMIIIISFSLFVLLQDTFFQKGQVRLKGSNVFDHYPQIYEQTREEMKYDAKLEINLIRKIFHDTSVPTSLDLIARGYLSHFSPDFLFFYLNQKHHHAPGVGLLYLWMMPFLLIGIYALFKMNRRVTIMVALWILIAPLPASITWDVPHAIRSVSMVIPLEIIASVGIWSFLKLLFKKRRVFSYSILFTLIIAVIVSFTYFSHQYFIHLPYEKSENWVYGREELAKYLTNHEKNYQKIIISTKLEWPYIFLLFYSAYDPNKYLSTGGTISGGWGEERNKFGIYQFHQFDYNKDKVTGKTLYVGEPGGFPSNVTPLKIIYYLNGKPGIYLVEKRI